MGTRRKGSTQWRGGHARAKFRNAFVEPYRRPHWLSDLEILPPPTDGVRPTAEAFIGPRVVKVKVLKDDRSRRNFDHDYPDHGCVLVVVGPRDPSERIRDVTFEALREYCRIKA